MRPYFQQSINHCSVFIAPKVVVSWTFLFLYEVVSIHGAKYLPTSEQLTTVRQKIQMDGLQLAVKVYEHNVRELVLDTWVYSTL